MALDEYRTDMEMCCRCSICKFVPLEKLTESRHSWVCPSVSRYNFHTYAGGGRMNMGVALLEKELEFDDNILDVVYNCQMCGACDISCKYAMDIDVLDPINEMRIKCVEEGHSLNILNGIINGLRNKGTMVPGAKAGRGEWAKGLDLKYIGKQKAKVIFHPGCRAAYNKDMWKVATATVRLLQQAGIDVGIAGENELCCGGRAYQMGYKEDFLNQVKKNTALINKSGAEILVTGCADCYHAFKVLYDKFGMKGELEVMHTTEVLDRLIKAGKLKPSRKLNVKITYHDPCHLGRLGEPYIHWKGKPIPGHIRIFDPPREFRRGTYGVYEPPRSVLKSIPGLTLIEMDRIKEYAWCCGAGGGVKESNPDFAMWTAKTRIDEALSTGAEAIVTACPGCEQNFKDTLKETGDKVKVYDIVELLEKAVLTGGR